MSKSTRDWWIAAVIGMVVSVLIDVFTAAIVGPGSTALGLVGGSIAAGLVAQVSGAKRWLLMAGSVLALQWTAGVVIILVVFGGHL